MRTGGTNRDVRHSNDLNISLCTTQVQEIWYLAFYEISTGNTIAPGPQEKYKKCDISALTDMSTSIKATPERPEEKLVI
jgi:hypothetical protein